jgi:hypothetical protein
LAQNTIGGNKFKFGSRHVGFLKTSLVPPKTHKPSKQPPKMNKAMLYQLFFKKNINVHALIAHSKNPNFHQSIPFNITLF